MVGLGIKLKHWKLGEGSANQHPLQPGNRFVSSVMASGKSAPRGPILNTPLPSGGFIFGSLLFFKEIAQDSFPREISKTFFQDSLPIEISKERGFKGSCSTEVSKSLPRVIPKRDSQDNSSKELPREIPERDFQEGLSMYFPKRGSPKRYPGESSK